MPEGLEGLDEIIDDRLIASLATRLNFLPDQVWFGLMNREIRLAIKKDNEIYGVGIPFNFENILRFDEMFNVVIEEIRHHFESRVDVNRRLDGEA